MGCPKPQPQGQVRSEARPPGRGRSAVPHVLLPRVLHEHSQTTLHGEETMGARAAQEEAGSRPGAGAVTERGQPRGKGLTTEKSRCLQAAQGRAMGADSA